MLKHFIGVAISVSALLAPEAEAVVMAFKPVMIICPIERGVLQGEVVVPESVGFSALRLVGC